MPITPIDYPHEVRHVQVLDADGNVDHKLEPKVPKEDLRRLYRTMILSREFDAARTRLQRAGEIGTFAPTHGQEAAQLGSIYVMRKQDWFVPSFRETACALWRGAKMENDLLYCAGFEEGMQIPEGAHDLPIAIPIGTQIAHAMGVAWASKIQHKDEVTIGYIGDGGTSEGDFHEAMNFAGVFHVPLIVMVQNNHWAISVPREKQTRSKTLAQKAWAYAIPGTQVDGNDILGVIHVTREAHERARKGGGPSLIEAITYRMSFHTTADDPKKYRKEEDVKAWEPKDPIKRFRTYLLDKKFLDEDEDKTLHTQVQAEIRAAIEKFRTSQPTKADNIFEHVFADLPAYTAKQRDEFFDYHRRHPLPIGGH